MGLKDIDAEALKLLGDNNWRVIGTVLDDVFIRRAREGESHDEISFAQLRDKGLACTRDEIPNERKRQEGLDWLRKRIAQPNPRA